MDNTNEALKELEVQLGKIDHALSEIKEREGKFVENEEFHAAFTDFAETKKSLQAVEAAVVAEQASRDALEARIDQMARAGRNETEERDEEHYEAYHAYLRTARKTAFFDRADIQAVEREQRSLVGSNLPEGGALVPKEVEAGILKDVVETSPVATLTPPRTITGSHWEKVKQSSVMTGYWVGEEERPTETAPKYEVLKITPGTAGAAVQATRYMLEQVSYLESEVTAEAGSALGKLVNTAFVTGTGVNKPRGFTIPGDVPFVTGTDTTNYNIHQNDFYKLLYGTGGADESGLSADYREKAVFVMNSNTLLATMLLVDDVARPLFQDGFREGAFSRIAGKPYAILEDMADDGTNDYLPLAVADWAAFYRIVQRPGMYVLRDPYSAKPSIEIDWYLDIGGDVILPKAGRLLKL